MLKLPTALVIIDQTDQLVLGRVNEHAALYNMVANKGVSLGEYYGNPTSGIISPDNSWAVVGGYDGFRLWTAEKITYQALPFVYEFRQINPTQFYILTDPWEQRSAIYLYDIPTKQLKEIAPFTDYLGQPHTDDVIW